MVLFSSTLSSGKYLVLTVADTGTGIKPEFIDRIFEPYFTTKDRGEGTGLGLATVHGIVDSYRGGISIDNKLGKGTTFNIYFPVLETQMIADEKGEIILEQVGGGERILFVDDEKMMVKIGERMLQGLGYKVTAVNDSLKALNLFKKNPTDFDLIFTDMTMPGMTGDVLSKKIIEINPSIPIIICSGFSKRMAVEKAKNLGIKEYLMKPFNQSELSNVIKKVLDKSKQKK
jgi:CheY-like chemotaxis protein